MEWGTGHGGVMQDLTPDMVFTRTLFNSRGNGGRDKEGEGGCKT